MHHLPEKFVGIGPDGKEKIFEKGLAEDNSLRALAEKHMFDIMQNSYKSPLKPDERANLTFYCQVLRQVLPAEFIR